ncbi:MAG: P-type DNA transfer ATPase VirB11 [Legionellales bacterium]|nr:P-type DNA transfer ATPase VirB11 [Legionellales bacterium]
MSDEPSTFTLQYYLKPLEPWLLDPEVNEILINRPGEVWIEKHSQLKQFPVSPLTYPYCWQLAKLIAHENLQLLDVAHPLVKGLIPGNHRVQIVAPPIVRKHSLAMSIRKTVFHPLSLDDYQQHHFFAATKIAQLPEQWKIASLNPDEEEKQLLYLFHQHEWLAFLKAAIQANKTILISGATSTGKTTLLNACAAEINHQERMITIEDVPEIHLIQPNQLNLVSSRGEHGMVDVPMSMLVQTALRLRPDRLILGEIRGEESADFMAALSTGHSGSFSTVHASSPAMAIERLMNLVRLNNNYISLRTDDIRQQLLQLIDVVVQVKRRSEGGYIQRYCSEMYFKSAQTELFT